MHKLKVHSLFGETKKKRSYFCIDPAKQPDCGNFKSEISRVHLEKLQLEVSVGPSTAEPISFLLRLQ